jgi:MFS family permease
VLTVLLALVAGAGTALYKPAILAGLPEIVRQERLPQATALFGALTELGFTLGPGAAAIVLAFSGPKALLLANAATFAISSLVLATLSFRYREQATPAEERGSLLRTTRDGIAVVARMPAARTVIASTSTILLVAGMVNVAELLLARHLGGGRVGYSLFVAATGVGIVLGSLTGASHREFRSLVRLFLSGVVLAAAGLLGTAAAPTLASALVCLAAVGFGNGMVIVYERLIIQRSVPADVHGRAFGAQVSLDGFAFAASFLMGGALLSVVSPRALFLIGGIGAALVWLVARQVFATIKIPDERSPVAEDPGAQAPVAIGASLRR